MPVSAAHNVVEQKESTRHGQNLRRQQYKQTPVNQEIKKNEKKNK